MQSQIQILAKDLAKAHEQISYQAAAANLTAAFTAPPSNEVAVAQPPQATLPPASLPVPAPSATPLPPLATAQPPLYPPGHSPYFDYGDEGSYFRPPRRQPNRRPPRSSVMRKVTLHTAAPPVRYCSAYCSNRHGKPLKDHQGDKSLNSPPRKVAKAPPRGI